MALSDACFEFLTDVGAAAERLAKSAHHYSAPDNPLNCGREIDALRREAARVSNTPYDTDAVARIVRLAETVMRFHDTPPSAAEGEKRAADMYTLVRLIQSEATPEEAEAVQADARNGPHAPDDLRDQG